MFSQSMATSHADRVLGAIRNVHGARRIDPEVAKSWNRCLHQYGIEPSFNRETEVLAAGEIKQCQQRFGELLSIARAEMENLYEQIAGSGYAVLLTDSVGTIISSISDATLKKDFRNAGLRLGAVWDEKHEGTNGVGTCIAEKRPVIVHRDEHYMGYNIALSCSGAPILDAQGDILAVLDASSANSGDTKAIQRHTMALVNMSANLVSKCHFLSEFPNAWVLRFHSRPEFVGLLHEALVAIDGNGHILAANDSAVTQLGFAERRALVGKPIEDLFQFAFSVLEQRGARDPNTLWPIRDTVHGRRFFAMVRVPLGEARAEAVSVATRSVATRNAPSTSKQSRETEIAASVGSDPLMQRNLGCARQLIEKQVSILLQGATGTGKEVFAKALHRLSSWSQQPFIAVNCAAIPESLIESELFGYARGAFTDASREGRRGKIQQASGGTLFLDEIGDMPLALQTRLLRVLEENEIIPLGAEKPIPVELHVISASHRDLRQMIADGEFRDDLYYRLNGITLSLPPLRERGDMAELMQMLLGEESHGQPLVRLNADASAALMRYSWPGNIRQLRNVLRTSAALCDDGLIRLSNLPQEILDFTTPPPEAAPQQPPAAAVSGHSALHNAERAALLQELERNRWNVTRTADVLGVSRNTLYRKMKKHAIEPKPVEF